MTPKERLKAAMNLEPHDRIPVMCQMSIGHMLVQLDVSPSEFWFDKDSFKNGLLKLRTQYGFDGILVSLHGHDPGWRSRIDAIEPKDGGERVRLKNGDVLDFPDDDLPVLSSSKYRDGPPLNAVTEGDLPSSLDYIPVTQNLSFPIHRENRFDILEELVQDIGGLYSVHGEITSPFDYLLNLFGVQDALVGLIDHPDRCLRVLSHFTGLIKDLATDMCATGIDAIKISSPFAGSGFISKNAYRTYVLPFEKEIVTAVRERGVPIYTHTCGPVNDRLDLMFESGISGIECLDPPPLGDVELNDALKRIGAKGFVKGNVDSVHTLLLGAEQEIMADLKMRLEVGRPWNGYILSTACSIAPHVPKDNVLLMAKAVELWGNLGPRA
jgi:hypothetical protein